jgi:long-chain acyl-CoA synthetase
MKELVYPRLLLPRVEQLPDKVAFVDVSTGGIRYQGTFASHLDRLLRLTHSMRVVLGIEPGDRFGVLAMNGHEYLELYHAAMFGAAIINPLNTRFTPIELAYVLNDSGSRVVFTDPEFAPILAHARVAGARIDKVVIIGGEPDAGVTGADATLGYEDLLAVGKPVMPPEPEEEDAAILMYTGGTTPRERCLSSEPKCSTFTTYLLCWACGKSADSCSSRPCSTLPSLPECSVSPPLERPR